jgi:hypothetical protein
MPSGSSNSTEVTWRPCPFLRGLDDGCSHLPQQLVQAIDVVARPGSQAQMVQADAALLETAALGCGLNANRSAAAHGRQQPAVELPRRRKARGRRGAGSKPGGAGGDPAR